MTCAPAHRASGTAIEPTPPPAPRISTVWPDSRWPWSNSACHDVERGLRNRRRFDEVDRLRLRRQAPHLNGHQLGGPAVAVTVDEAVHLVTHRKAGRAITERDHDARPLVRRDAPTAVVAVPIDRQRPQQLGRSEARGAHLHECVAHHGLRIGSVLVLEAIDALDALRFLQANGLHRSLLSHQGRSGDLVRSPIRRRNSRR